ncbi:MAG: excinuclease ABC subunit C [Chloroflexi bacterium RBG_13_60_13]|nr:MAG: excinuclease ABC subunit C [Chloroflexi bacterium RBG_13_60_13]
MKQDHLQQQWKTLPAKPGVYLMKDEQDNVLYVGKAASLHHRIASYFGSPDSLSLKTSRMMAQAADIDFYVTDSEQEAMLLECSLIKKYHPRYNMRLKDDKSYPYLKISLNEDWPRVYITRRVENDGARYFGPYASAGSLRTTLALLKKLFPFRHCRGSIVGRALRPCLEYDIRRCLGPCIGAVSRQEYARMVHRVVLFLEGKHELILRELKGRMRQAADDLDFEKAAMLRDQIQAVNRVTEEQKIAQVEGEADVIAFAQGGDQAYVLVFFIRQGKLIGREHFILTGTRDEGTSQIMTSFVQQFYVAASHIPRRILLEHPADDMPLVEVWLAGRRGKKVELRVPRRGSGKGLVDMVAENARLGLEQTRVKSLAAPDALAEALGELQRVLSLPALPERVEGYDVSNIQGTSAVGSMVVFEGGLPRKSRYRLFRIKSVAGANDYAMLQEVLSRRFRRAPREYREGSWGTMPDLVLIDGGRGQLNAALEVMKETGAGSIPCVSLAKENEALFVPGASGPIILPRQSAALQFVQRVRDEAHRFAVGYYHKVQRRGAFSSSLDGIPGVGAKRRRALLKRFGSVKRIREATLDELASVEGMTRFVARRVKEHV